MKLLVIFPCYNEEEILESVIQRFFTYFEELVATHQINANSKICFVDDGSADRTWERISAFKESYVMGVKLSANFGHQKALWAGLETFKDRFDAYATLDVDLQDDYTVLDEMIARCKEGNDIVYGARNDRSVDSFVGRTLATSYYRFVRKMGIKSVYNSADFRLISNKALLALMQFGEYHLYLRGMFPIIGLKNTVVYYARKEREKGTSKYPIRKSIALAWDGITSFSSTPLRFVLFVGIFAVVVALALFIWALVVLIMGKTVTGWFSLITIITFFGGIQTMAIGLVGEYIGKIYMQSKNRPRFLVDTIIGDKDL